MDSKKKEIHSIVKRYPGISKSNIVERCSTASKNTVIKTLDDMVKNRELQVEYGGLKRGRKPGGVTDNKNKNRRSIIGYYAPDFPMDKTLDKQVKDNLEKLRSIIDEIENDSETYNYTLKQQVNGILEHVRVSIPESIADHRDYYASMLQSHERDIHDETREVLELVDKRVDIDPVVRIKVRYILDKIRDKLCRIERQRAKHDKEKQNASSTSKRKEIGQKLEKDLNEYEKQHKALLSLRFRVETQDLSHEDVEKMLRNIAD